MRWVVTYFINPDEPEEKLVVEEFEDEREVYCFMDKLTSEQCPLFFRSDNDSIEAAI